MNLLSTQELTLVLSYINKRDVFCVSLVSKLWNSVAKRKEFWWRIIRNHMYNYLMFERRICHDFVKIIIEHFNPFHADLLLSESLCYMYNRRPRLFCKYRHSHMRLSLNDVRFNFKWDKTELLYVTIIYKNVCIIPYMSQDSMYDKPISCKFYMLVEDYSESISNPLIESTICYVEEITFEDRITGEPYTCDDNLLVWIPQKRIKKN